MPKDFTIANMGNMDANLPAIGSKIEEMIRGTTGKNLPFIFMVIPDVPGQRTRTLSNLSENDLKRVVRQLVHQWGRDEGNSKILDFNPITGAGKNDSSQ